ncbi:MAG: glycoside hydrolase family 88 protein [Defluviicoccus sp.]|nr:glycoside hydrolase family 88 protein [Defluviicoccus sp.]MDE0383673.1 glycoside hydrolase family 88 protein [Defluviicoccus sp.]
MPARKTPDDALDAIAARIRATVDADPPGFPHYADADTGAWTTTPDGFWTGGYWNAMLWLGGAVFDDAGMVAEARRWTERLRPRIGSESVFRGFLFYYGAALGAILHRDEDARDLALAASGRLAGDFDPRLGLIPLGAEAEEAHTVGASEANIDGLAAVPLLLFAAQSGGEPVLRDRALAHTLRSAALCVRDDGSVVQSVSLDPETGAPLRTYTHKGVSDSSTWTRAQAWAMQFLGHAGRLLPEETAPMDAALRVTDWWIDNVPNDRVAYWDFDAPIDHETRKDTSGTAIAATAILKLSETVADPDAAARYRAFAEETLLTLAACHLTPVAPRDRRPPGILTNGCFDQRSGVALANELIWGSYYLLEGLAMLAGRLESGRI